MIPLEDVYAKYGRPDPADVSKLPKRGAGGETVYLDYVGHAAITRILLEIDPGYTWEPLEIVNGRPAVHIHAGSIPRRNADPIPVEMATLWGYLTLHGVRRLAVGSVEAHKPDLDKELVSDFLRNAAMRFGIALDLWAKDSASAPAEAARTRSNASKPPEGMPVPDGGGRGATDAQKRALRAIAYEKGANLPDLDRLSTREASAMIDDLKSRPNKDRDATPVATDEDPF